MSLPRGSLTCPRKDVDLLHLGPAADCRSTGGRFRIVQTVAPPDPVTFVLAVVLAAAISAGVFAHASKHGSRHATAWGVAAFLAAGVAVPLYFIRYWARRGGRK